MITNGFTYIAVLAFIAALLIGAQKLTKWKFFDFAPPVVLLYLIAMICCTCGVASLANIGGTASAPILAASYSGSLTSVGVLMALLGYIVGTYGGWFVGYVMSLFG